MSATAPQRRGHTEVGRWGESLAASILTCNGYSLLERNWRQPAGSEAEPVLGEIDLVMVDPEMNLVFIEVKTRSGIGFGHPFEAVSRDKAKKLRELAFAWVRSQETYDFTAMRIDAVAICGSPQSFTFEHLEAVV